MSKYLPVTFTIFWLTSDLGDYRNLGDFTSILLQVNAAVKDHFRHPAVLVDALRSPRSSATNRNPDIILGKTPAAYRIQVLIEVFIPHALPTSTGLKTIVHRLMFVFRTSTLISLNFSVRTHYCSCLVLSTCIPYMLTFYLLQLILRLYSV